MKILFASPIGKDAGGITRWADHIITQYESSGISDVYLDILPMNSHDRGVAKGLVDRIKNGIYTYLQVLFSLKKCLKNNEYDILHIASSASISLLKDMLMIKVARSRGVKTIIHFHFGRIPELFQQNNWEWKLLSQVAKMANVVIVIDDTSYNTLVKAGFSNVENIPNPLSPKIQKFIQAKKVIKRENRTILFVGHCIETKGVNELVGACKQIPDIKLNLLGAITPEMTESLSKLSNNADWLNIMGQRTFSDVILEMMKCTIFVLPTYTEGFPNVILESMACACPIITTPVGAIPQMLDIESVSPCGICVPCRDVDSLYNAINNLLADVERRELLSSNAQKRVNQQYLISSIWDKLLNVWRNVIN